MGREEVRVAIGGTEEGGRMAREGQEGKREHFMGPHSWELGWSEGLNQAPQKFNVTAPLLIRIDAAAPQFFRTSTM